VKIGVQNGNENFFKINTWNYRSTVPGFYPEKGDCNASIQGSTEGALFPQMSTKETVVWYWRKTLCRSVPLYFDEEIQWGNLKAFKYVLRENSYDRFENKSADCYKGHDLPDGLTDVSKCFFGMKKLYFFVKVFSLSSIIALAQIFFSCLNFFFSDQPIVASFPHFLARAGNFTDRLEGIHPDKEKHQSYSIIEPVLGVPLNQRASSQSNVVTGNLRGFKYDIAKFSNMVIPMFWIEFVNCFFLFKLSFSNIDSLQYLKEVTPLIISTVDFIVNTLPSIQYWISAGYIVFGLCLLMIGYLRLRNNGVAKEKKAKIEDSKKTKRLKATVKNGI
jgi:hypothetical protein